MNFNHNFKKHYGQNFLVDNNIINKIVSCIDCQQHDNILEIGPGLGAITNHLVGKCKSLTLIEIDKALAEKLNVLYQNNDTVHVINQDVLKTVIQHIYPQQKIIGNLPYNISSPILFHCINAISTISECTFMLQKEVGERICAKENTKEYGRLSVMIQHFFKPELLFTIGANAFYPTPKVDSVIVKLHKKDSSLFAENYQDFADIVKTSFAMRRKTIANNLKRLISAKEISMLQIPPNARAENLSLAQFIILSNFYTKKS